MPELPEFRRPANVILPESRLRFVDSQRNSVTGGQTNTICTQALLVKGVPSFVHNSVQRNLEAFNIIACGNALVEWTEACRKRVHRGVDPPRRKIIAKGRRYLLGKRFLPVNRIVTV